MWMETETVIAAFYLTEEMCFTGVSEMGFQKGSKSCASIVIVQRESTENAHMRFKNGYITENRQA